MNHTAEASYRIGIIAPDEALLAALWQAIQRPGVDVAVTTDSRDVRTWLQGGALDLIALDASLERPAALDLAAALHKATRGRMALALLTPQVQPVPEGSVIGLALRRTTAPRVTADRLIRAAMEARHAGAFDDTELRAEVEVRGIRGGDLTFYEVLDVPTTASADAIKAAYDRLSLVFHPDRLRNIQDEALRAQAAELYDRIQTAYEVLRSGIERARYNRELRAGSPTSVTQSARPVSRQSLLSMEEWATDPAARRALKTAQQALTAKDQALAKLQLQFALAREPENALIREKLAELDAGK